MRSETLDRDPFFKKGSYRKLPGQMSLNFLTSVDLFSESGFRFCGLCSDAGVRCAPVLARPCWSSVGGMLFGLLRLRGCDFFAVQTTGVYRHF